MRLTATRTSVTSAGGAGGAGDALYRAAGGKPTLDQRFAKDKALVDKISGNNLITFSRASSGTYVDSDGLIKTAVADAPRFDHDPVTGESLGLLIEEARTNLINYSEDFTQWPTYGPISRSVDGTLAPDNTATATKLLCTGTSKSVVHKNVGTGDQVRSFFAKAGSTSFVFIDSPASTVGVWFDLSSGNVQGTGGSIVPFANGWYRCIVATDFTANNFAIGPSNSLGTDSTTNGQYLYIWGAQVEAGSFPTSYLPTSGSAATRAADICSIEGGNFSSWYNQSEGTVFVEANNLPYGGGLYYFGPTAAPRWWSRYEIPNGIRTQAYDGVAGSGLVDLTVPGVSNNETIPTLKHVIAIDNVAEEQVGATNGSSVLNGSWDNVSGVTALRLGHRQDLGTSGFLNGHISRLAYFTTRKTDQELIKITDGTLAPAIITYGITNAGGTFNLRSTGTVDYAVDWDSTGGYEESTSNTLPHTYTAGDYDLVVYSEGVYRPFFNNVTADADQITSVAIGSGADLGTNLDRAWRGANNMTSFVCPFDVTSLVANFNAAWRNCTSLTSFPLLDVSSGTSFPNAWFGCTSLTDFPELNTSSGTNFSNTWRDCNSLTNFPLLNTSSGTTFYETWRGCSNLISFPLLNTSSGVDFYAAWFTCTSLTTFPANMFDTTGTLVSSAFNNAWYACALTAQSIENILVSLDTNGATGITLGIHGGTNAAKTTWSAAAVTAYDNLTGIVKGWTISFNA